MNQDKMNLQKISNKAFTNEGFNPPKSTQGEPMQKGFNPPKTSQPKPVEKPNK